MIRATQSRTSQSAAQSRAEKPPTPTPSQKPSQPSAKAQIASPSARPAAPSAPPPRKELQTARSQLETLGHDVQAKGKANPQKSTEALKTFQQSAGLEASGKLDKATRQELREASQRTSRAQGDYVVRGMKGEPVAKTEKQLQKLGYDVGQADGVFDAKLQDAVKAFRSDQKLGGPADALGAKGLKALSTEAKALAHDPYHQRVTATPERALKDLGVAAAAATVDASGQQGLGVGASGAEVAYMQQHLRAAGFDPKSTGGQFDERTAGALEAFQRRSGLQESGRLDQPTWAKLMGATRETAPGAPQVLQQGEKSAAVARNEKLLGGLGYDVGKLDGVFDDKMLAASKAFEKARGGLGTTGAIGEAQTAAMQRALENKQALDKLHGALRSDLRNALKEARASNTPLQFGSRGEQVKTLQTRLNALGFNSGAADGIFGPKTQAAVTRFQASRGLAADGIVGKQTRTAAGLNLAAGAAKQIKDLAGAADSVAKLAQAAGFDNAAVAKFARVAGRANQITNLLDLPGSAARMVGDLKKGGDLARTAASAFTLGQRSVDAGRVVRQAAANAAERTGLDGKAKLVLSKIAQTSAGAALARSGQKLLSTAGGRILADSLTSLGKIAKAGGRAASRFVPGANIAMAALDIRDAIRAFKDPNANAVKKLTSAFTAIGSVAAATNIPIVSQAGAAVSAVSGLIGDGQGISRAVGTAGRAISQGVSTAARTISHGVSNVTQGVSNVARDVADGVSSVARRVSSGARRAARTVGNAVRSVGNTVRRAVDTARSTVGDVARTVGHHVSNGARAVTNTARNVIRSINPFD